jgi:ribonuclease P protein component
VSKKSVIKKSSEIKTILQTGRYVSNQFFKIAYRPSANEQSRWAVLIGRRYGKAVERNRIKRQLREILRGVTPRLGSRVDLLVIPKRTEGGLSFKLMEDKVHHCFKQEGLL